MDNNLEPLKPFEPFELFESIQTYLQRIQFDPEKPDEKYETDEEYETDESYSDDLYIDDDDLEDDSSKVSIVIPELYMRFRYGNNPYLKSHIMVLYRFKYNNSAKFFKYLEKIASFHRHIMWRRAARTLYNKGYSINKIYTNISCKHNISYQVHLAQCIRLPTGETVCVIKTFWLKIIQRTWKKVFKERQRVLKNIYLRQIRGKVFIPSLTGMLWFYGV
jgi:hypothetical protein